MEILKDKKQLSVFLTKKDQKVIDVMRFIDANAKKAAYLCDGNKLVASVSDGDIRRFMLRGGDLESDVLEAANKEPKYVFEKDIDNVGKIMDKYGIDSVPVVDEDKNITAIAYAGKIHKVKSGNLDLPVIIMAGGKGTRLYPYTKILPKPLIPIGDLPIIEHIIDRYKTAGSKDYYLILNHKKNMIKSYFNDLDKGYNVVYIDEEKPLGTGGGLSLLKGKIDKTAFLTNCDILIDADYEDIYSEHKKSGNVATMVCAFKHITIPYGVVNVEKGGGIMGFDEKPEFSFMVNTGMYMLEPEVIEMVEEDTPIGMPDIFEKLRNAGKKVGVYPIGEKAWMDMGQLEELENMRKQMGV